MPKFILSPAPSVFRGSQVSHLWASCNLRKRFNVKAEVLIRPQLRACVAKKPLKLDLKPKIIFLPRCHNAIGAPARDFRCGRGPRSPAIEQHLRRAGHGRQGECHGRILARGRDPLKAQAQRTTIPFGRERWVPSFSY